MKLIWLALLILSPIIQAKKVKILVPGMVCQMCVQGMRTNFKNLVHNPEKDVIVDLDKKTVLVNFKSEDVSEATIKQRVKDAGYNAADITWIDSTSKDNAQ